jgi:hypothetical protein
MMLSQNPAPLCIAGRGKINPFFLLDEPKEQRRRLRLGDLYGSPAQGNARLGRFTRHVGRIKDTVGSGPVPIL